MTPVSVELVNVPEWQYKHVHANIDFSLRMAYYDKRGHYNNKDGFIEGIDYYSISECIKGNPTRWICYTGNSESIFSYMTLCDPKDFVSFYKHLKAVSFGNMMHCETYEQYKNTITVLSNMACQFIDYHNQHIQKDNRKRYLLNLLKNNGFEIQESPSQ